VTEVHIPIDERPSLTTSEMEQVTYGFNDIVVRPREDRLVQEMLEEQVLKIPNSTAVSYENVSLTYAELNGRANQVAWYLRGLGVGPDEVVAIYIERGLALIVGLLGVLKAGGAYLPIDPSYPTERVAFMLKDSSPRVVLTLENLKSTVPPSSATVVGLDSDWSDIAEESDRNVDPGSLHLTSRNLAYVIYTSGSTGEPKGVAADHYGAVNRIAAQRFLGPYTDNDVCCQKTSIGFVDSVFEILMPLSYGRPLVVASAEATKDVEKLAAVIHNEHVTRLISVPSLASLVVNSDQLARRFKGVRGWTLSGEELKVDLLRKLRLGLPQCEFVNLYGSSEVAADVTCHALTDEEYARVPIGHPIANIHIYILDPDHQPVATGVEGEIYVGGAGVARGYFRKPEMTAERFIADQFSRVSGARVYKTGDFGRWRSDGVIEYLGRIDNQLKIRGFRVEIGEIEGQLALHAEVEDAVVSIREDFPGEKRLVAYVVCKTSSPSKGDSQKSSEIDVTGPFRQRLIPRLREYLKERLPEYMIPAAWVTLKQLPLTPNGKVDRRALPAPESRPAEMGEYIPPRTEMERTLADIWAQILRVDQVGALDNFFELGGHSLLIVKLMERLRRVGLSVELRSVYANPILADLARTLTGKTSDEFVVPPNLIPPGCKAITPQMLPLVELEPEQIEQIERTVPGGAENIQDIYPLAPLQEGILFHHLLNGDQKGDIYVRSLLLSLSSRQRLEELIQALQGVIDRHDILRTALLWEQFSRPVQVVHRWAVLPVEELVLDLNRDPVEQLQERMKPERQRLDLRRAPLMRLQVAADAREERWYALLQTHHLVCDNESLDILIAEVMAQLEGQAMRPPEAVPYRNHVAQTLAHARTHDAEAFFRSKFGEIDEPTAPFGLLDVHGDGSRIRETRQVLETGLGRRIRTQARRLGVSAATLFHAAWALVVSRTSGRDDVVYGTVLLGRLHGSAGAQRILGMFINTLPLGLRLREATARGLVEQTRQELAELLNHEQASLAVAQRCSGIAGSAPLFTTLLNYRHSSENQSLASTWDIEVVAVEERTNYPIALSVDDYDDGFVLSAQTDCSLAPDGVIGYITTALQSLTDALYETPLAPAATLSILPDREWHQIIHSFNATQEFLCCDKLVHECFEEQCRRSPLAVAVSCSKIELTYAELNRRANKLAHALLARGVRPDGRVAIFLDRGIDLIVVLLGVLKAGGAYVPLDVNYPSDRIAYMLRDSAPSVLVTQRSLKGRLPESDTQVMLIDSEKEEIGGSADYNVESKRLGLSPSHLAYIVYTSGSTGRPKGVMVAHRNVVNLMNWHCATFNVNERSRCSCVAAIGFDAAAWEIWPPLSVGGRLALSAPELAGDIEALLAWWTRESFHVSFLPTPIAEIALSRGSSSKDLKVLLVGGDRLRSHPKDESFSVVNNYGPTECTVVATSGRIRDDDDILHIGHPIANTQVYILDEYRRPVPVGVTGELYIGGAGVARGYMNRPDLTAGRFVADTFSAEPQAKMYRSGDLGRWRTDGTIEFLGRNDDQVKIRGYRIELGEIEAQLARLVEVKDAVVTVHEIAGADKCLVAYVTSSITEALNSESVRSRLRAVLPDYMVPRAVVVLASLPLTPNGKLDRRALPAPALAPDMDRRYEPARGEIEETLARIWKEVLGVERVGRLDNFFELGGHSLLAMQVIVRIRASFLIEMPMKEIFRRPTLDVLSSKVFELRRERLLQRLAEGGSEMEELLERLASMPDGNAEELVRKLTMGAKS
jgi:amino acid adenylation domain-containing protein